MNRGERVDVLVRAIERRDPRSAELTECAASLQACFLRWSMDACIRWTVELAVDGCTKEQIEEAARLVARNVRDPSPADLSTEARALRHNEQMLSKGAEVIEFPRRLPGIAGGLRSSRIAVSVYADIASRLLSADGFDAEFERRRSMTDAEIAERQAELRGAGGA